MCGGRCLMIFVPSGRNRTRHREQSAHSWRLRQFSRWAEHLMRSEIVEGQGQSEPGSGQWPSI